MENNQPDNTIKEILEEDRTQVRRKRRGGGCVVRLLIIAILLFVGFYGFILFRQKMLDIEAEAVIRARQTLTNQVGAPKESDFENTQPSSEESSSDEPTAEFMLEHTATVEVQLTDVAEFQQSVTPNP